MLRWEDDPGSSWGVHCNYSVLISERQGRKGKTRDMAASEGLDPLLLALKMGGIGSPVNECRQPLEGRKGKGMDPLLEPSEGKKAALPIP